MAESGLRRWAFLRRTPLHPQWLLGSQRVFAELLRRARGRVLDIGCADRWVEGALPAGCTYVGVDYPATGRDLYAARPDLYADAGRLPIGDASVDTVVLFEVLEHLRAPQAALGEIARVLRPGGLLLLTVPFLYPVHDAPHDYQRYTRHGLERDVTAAGFAVDVLEPMFGSAETAGLLASLAMGGMLLRAWQGRRPALVLAPLLLAGIVCVNLSAWLIGKLFPAWDAFTAGYRLMARKP